MKRLLVALLAFVASACATAPSAPSGTASSPTASSPGPSTEAQWRRIELPNSAESFLATVAATDHDALVLGVAGETPKAWSAKGGAAWIEESMPPGGGYPSAAIALGDRIVVIGGKQTDRCAHPGEIAFWARDSDGRWFGAPFEPFFCAGGSAHIASNGDIAAVIGFGTGDVPYVWTSPDGLAWASRPVRRDISPGRLASVESGFAAVGTFPATGRWWFGRSQDGADWTIVPFFDPWAESVPVGLAAAGRGFMTWFMNPGQLAFTSLTGDVWEPVQMQGLDGVELVTVARYGERLVALGRVDAGARLFVSRDGIRWRRVIGPDQDSASSYSALAVSADEVLLLGTVHTGPDADVTAAWTAPAAILDG